MATWVVSVDARDGTGAVGHHDVVADAMRIIDGGVLIFERNGEVLCAWGPDGWLHVGRGR
jgi:hypothetical protein